MRVGLLISEFKDKDVCKLCFGADAAARNLGVELVIFPGKYIITDKSYNEKRPCEYQYQAVYDYIFEAGFDGLIVDIGKIGKNAPILKNEKFLSQFGRKPILTLKRTDGFDCVEAAKDTPYEELGYLCVEQILSAITGNEVKAIRETSKELNYEDAEKTLHKLTELSEIISQDRYKKDNFDSSMKKLIAAGIENLELYMLENPAECSLKRGWQIPKHCRKVIAITGKKFKSYNKVENISTTDIFDKSEIISTKVVRNIFFNYEQYGVLLTDLCEDYKTGFYDDMFVNIILSGIRINYLLKNLKDTEEELSVCQEELARDGSVLDHMGGNDFLTGLPNRRGFFADAYDLLKEKFKQDTFAVVAYIDMESLKNINAIHGHDEGDNAVRRVAEILKEVFGESSVCGRIRGDEFAVIQVTDEEDKAEALRIEMARQNNKLLIENTKYLNHLIYSICEFGFEDSLSLREMLKETDDNLKNMRRMETAGRNF